ncbi:flagellar hook-length control protein FliK [Dongia deserti]|uniref:flagellar hook-length control protein FliK n=1 Tax=Dongia deserti TaxID=2268030 RepID=UPI000E659C1F|nr:flagellar hook-length control protein FliK [Dongia deserti]
MQTIQFDPKITTDLPINWHRPGSGQASDMFADLLADRMKQNVQADRREPVVKRHQHPSDPVSGHPPRIVISHAHTMRGEAKEMKDACRDLTDQRCVTAAEETPVAEESTEATPQPEMAETPAETEATIATEELAQVADQQVQSPDSAVTVVVATQPTEQTEVDGEQELALTLELPTPAEGESLVLADAENAASAATDGSHQKTDAAMKQQATEAMADAALSDVAVALTSEGTMPVTNTDAPVVATQPNAAPAPAAGGAAADKPLLRMPDASQPIAQLAPTVAQPQADRRAMDTKIRPSVPRPHASASDPKPNTPAAPQSAQPHPATPFQPSTTTEFAGLGDPLGQPFSPEGSGPGWTLHLAQGAASKRPDFVAQLRQHLQNLPAHEQVAVHVQRALRDGTRRFSVQLSPAELGRIQVKLEIDEDKRVTAAVTVERSSTLELLQRDIKGLERALHNAGLSLEGGDLSFSLGRGTDQEFAQDLNRSATSAAGRSAPDAEADGEQRDSAAGPVVNTAAGVVDVQV